MKLEINNDIILLDGVRYKREEKKPYDFICKYSGEGFYKGEKYFYIRHGHYRNPVLGDGEIPSAPEHNAYFHTKEEAIEWNAKKFTQVPEKKLIHEFEGHKYYEGDNYFYFIKRGYEIEKGTLLNTSILLPEENIISSKTYPTEQLCEEARDQYIWENHKLSESERELLMREFHHEDHERGWKEFFITKIIESK